MPGEIRFDGQAALVTGAGRGLGRAHALLLARLGARVLVNDVDGDRARDVAGEVGERAVADSSDLATRAGCEAAVDAVLERFGRIDVLVCNAGVVAFSGIEATDEETWERLTAVNVAAPFWLCRASWPHMRAQRYGRIVLTVSGVAMSVERALVDTTAYAVGKAAQFGLVNALGAEGAPHGIRVNAISPVAATRMYRGEVEPGELAPELVAPAVAYLASSACDRSGLVVRAADGQFSVGGYTYTEPVDLGRAPVEPDRVAELAEAASGRGAPAS